MVVRKVSKRDWPRLTWKFSLLQSITEEEENGST